MGLLLVGLVLLLSRCVVGQRLALRLFFDTMILGYRCVSFVFRRFRFADNWSLRNSTIDRVHFERSVAQAGQRILSTDALEGHLIFELGKGDSP